MYMYMYMYIYIYMYMYMYIYRRCSFSIMQSRNRHSLAACSMQRQYLYFSTSKASKFGTFPLAYARHAAATPAHRLYTCW